MLKTASFSSLAINKHFFNFNLLLFFQTIFIILSLISIQNILLDTLFVFVETRAKIHSWKKWQSCVSQLHFSFLTND